MGQRNNHNRQPPKRRGAASAPSHLKAAPATIPRPKAIEYGKPFVVLEDGRKNVFVIQDGKLVSHATSIADYRRNSRVKEMPQKIKGLTRYEICLPIN